MHTQLASIVHLWLIGGFPAWQPAFEQALKETEFVAHSHCTVADAITTHGGEHQRSAIHLVVVTVQCV